MITRVIDGEISNLRRDVFTAIDEIRGLLLSVSPEALASFDARVTAVETRLGDMVAAAENAAIAAADAAAGAEAAADAAADAAAEAEEAEEEEGGEQPPAPPAPPPPPPSDDAGDVAPRREPNFLARPLFSRRD